MTRHDDKHDGKEPATFTHQEWTDRVLEPQRDRHPERRARFVTASGRIVEALYLPACPDDAEYRSTLGFPGAYPYTRGVHPSMYRSRLWQPRQYSGFGTASDANRRLHALRAGGAAGLSIAFDLPTQIGYDSDHPMAGGEVGRVGVAIDTVDDLDDLLQGIGLETTAISMTINATAPVLLAMLICVAERRNVAPSALRGTLQNDILKEFVARGTYRFAPAPSLRLGTDVVEHCLQHLPRFNPISVSGYHMREAGATAAQEVAFTIAHALEYARSAIERGIAVDDVARRFTFFFAAYTDLIEEVAKFRAARRLFARAMHRRFGASPEACAMRMHAQTGGATLTATRPELNVCRVTIQSLAAVLGGVQSLHTNSWDEALSLPSDGAVQIALATQHVLALESGVAHTIDPLGGSYAVEAATDALEREAQTYVDEIDRAGGAVAAIEQRIQVDHIERASVAASERLHGGESPVVGVTEHVREDDVNIPEFEVPHDVEARQVRALQARRAQRPPEHAAALDALAAAASDGRNVMESLIAAVRLQASIGEICATLDAAIGRSPTERP